MFSTTPIRGSLIVEKWVKKLFVMIGNIELTKHIIDNTLLAHHITLHYITLHYITLHHITLRYINIALSLHYRCIIVLNCSGI
jgi:hypothetical protein